jgi:hypothetical protein
MNQNCRRLKEIQNLIFRFKFRSDQGDMRNSLENATILATWALRSSLLTAKTWFFAFNAIIVFFWKSEFFSSFQRQLIFECFFFWVHSEAFKITFIHERENLISGVLSVLFSSTIHLLRTFCTLEKFSWKLYWTFNFFLKFTFSQKGEIFTDYFSLISILKLFFSSSISLLELVTFLDD